MQYLHAFACIGLDVCIDDVYPFDEPLHKMNGQLQFVEQFITIFNVRIWWQMVSWSRPSYGIFRANYRLKLHGSPAFSPRLWNKLLHSLAPGPFAGIRSIRGTPDLVTSLGTAWAWRTFEPWQGFQLKDWQLNFIPNIWQNNPGPLSPGLGSSLFIDQPQGTNLESHRWSRKLGAHRGKIPWNAVPQLPGARSKPTKPTWNCVNLLKIQKLNVAASCCVLMYSMAWFSTSKQKPVRAPKKCPPWSCD